METYKDVLVDGLPTEDGGYLVILKDVSPVPRLLVRYTNEDGSRTWTSTDRQNIEEDRILMYKRILITPDRRNSDG